tara:strand:- start:794 stop:2731 length:1938 start_codon:yes stop_codon:yes gene_type:complete
MSGYVQLPAIPSLCENSTIGEISSVLNNFFGKISGAVGSANDFVDEIRETAGLITDITQGLSGQMTLFLEDKLVGFIENGLAGVKSFFFSIYKTNPALALLQTKAFNGAALKPIQRLFNTFGCLGATIANSMFKTIEDMLVNAVKKGIVNPVVCAVEDFVGALTNQITNTVNSALDGLISPINKLFGLIPNFGGFNILDKLNGFIGQANNAFSIAGSILKCVEPGKPGGPTNCPTVTEYKLNQGAIKPKSEQEQATIFEKAFGKGQKAMSGVNDKLSKFEQNIGTWGIFGSEDGEARDPIECNTGNVFECGPPRLEFFGGDGQGAAGDIILGNFVENFVEEIQDVEGINEQVGSDLIRITEPFEARSVLRTASIIGVDITYPGEGYTEEPFVSLVDNCDQGYGAYGRATIDKDPNSPTFGQVTGVIITSQGENYPAGEIEDAFVEEIVVQNGGIGYSEDDTIEDFEICGLDENGTITKVCTNDKVYRELPNLNINTITGTGAILKPVMTRKRRQTGVINVIDCITPKGNIVGYVNGKPYNGPFHVHPTTGQKMVGVAHTTSTHASIYNTPQESLGSGGSVGSNLGSSKINLRSIQQLVQESETTQSTDNMNTYSDPIDEADDTTPPSSPPPSPPSSGSSGGGYGY